MYSDTFARENPRLKLSLIKTNAGKSHLRQRETQRKGCGGDKPQGAAVNISLIDF